jgi:integrase
MGILGGERLKGHVRKRGSKWCFVIELGRDPQTGKRRQKWVSGFDTKKEAQKAMHEMLAKVARNEYVEPAKVTIGELMDMWFEQYVKTKCRPKSIETYERLIRLHIKPAIGKMKVNQIKPLHIQQFLSEQIGKLETSTIRMLRSACRNAFQWGIDMEIVGFNPVEKAKPPKRQPKEMKYWDEEQVKRFLEVAKDHRYYPIFYLAIFTGMRRGEILGLKWEDVDLETGRISIKRTLVNVNSKMVLQDAPKTKNARRVVDISESVVEVLKQHKKRQAEEMLMMGIRSDMVFTSLTGQFVKPSNLAKSFQRLTVKTGNPRIRFHDLRHTHATLMLKAGVHPKVVSERLGHSSISITLDTYSHVIPSMQKDAANLMDSLISSPTKIQRQ